MRRVPARQEKAEPARWKVQLELAPAEIALVFRQGLARGAEVCRHGTQDWRPLVTTPELRSALTVSWPLRVAPRPSSTLSVYPAPPPPPVIRTMLPVAAKRDRIDSVPDSAVTQPFPRPVTSPTLVLSPAQPAPQRPLSEPPLGFTRPALHARPWELSIVATLSMAITLLGTWLGSRAMHSSTPTSAVTAGQVSAPSEPATPTGAAHASATERAPASGIPVVPLRDLPLEHAGGAARASGASSSRGAPGSVDRGELARALGRAARSASGCGPGPVNTQIVVTFAPSGVARFIHFASSPPPASMQSCVLNAVARSRVPSFEGPAISVSKTFRW
ncbi:MAG TPA: hypothetical protein VGL19_12455 [Polyangiaceae bacterium]